MKQILQSLLVVVLVSSMMISCQKEEVISMISENTHSESGTVYQSDSPIEGQYIIVFDEKSIGFDEIKLQKAGVSPKTYVLQSAQSIFDDQGMDIGLDEVKHVYSGAFAGLCVKADASQMNRMLTDSRIVLIEQDRVINIGIQQRGGKKPSKDGGGSNNQPAQKVPWGVARVKAGVKYTGSNVAWIIDTGIDLDHPDLNVNTKRGYNAFTKGKDGRSLDDGNGHGTHVAGTVAALDNTIGVIGVAAGATVIPIKVLGSDGSGSYSGVIAGIDHVASNGQSGDVANLSLGGSASTAIDKAVSNAAGKGIIMCLAAGNSAQNASNFSPARVNGNNIFTISAFGQNDVFANFSNYGNPPVDYSAPGVSIQSTWKDGGYNTISGTSMAAPHAAGLFLLGSVTTDGTVVNDKDASPDPIVVR